jgi:hypothetical protein
MKAETAATRPSSPTTKEEGVTEIGRKFDDGRLRFSLIPWDALCMVVPVLEHGAEKYGVNNWRHVPDGRRRYFDAAMRHLVAWWGGERVDVETGQSHVAHAVASLLFVLVLDAGPASPPLARFETSGAATNDTIDDEEDARLARDVAERPWTRQVAQGGLR